MKTLLLRPLFLAFSLAFPALARAAEGEVLQRLHAGSLPDALLLMAVFAAVGIVVAIVGYRLFDKFTPGDMHKEIIENKNVAAAIVAAAVILGVSIIVAAAMIG